MFPPETKILILDDMMLIRKTVKRCLNELGYTDITEVNDGREGWQALIKAERPFQLVISDWNMPNFTGIELLKLVRKDPRFEKLPFVLLTAEAEMSQVVEALEVGVSNYILKPFSAATFKEKLELVYKKHNPG